MAKNGFLYQRVYGAILDDVQQGRLAPGGKLPPTAALMKEYGVSRITVDKALEALVRQGYVRRVPGRGSFVRQFGPGAGGGARPGVAPQTTGGKGRIGIVLEHVSTPFGLDMMYRLDLCAEKNGYKTLLRFSLGDRGRETEEIEFLTGLGIDGLIIMPCHGRHYNPSLLRLYLEGFPVVMVDKNMKGIKLPSVRTDNAAAVRGLVNTLVSRGCRRLALLTTGDTDAVSVRERRRGFIDGIDAAGVSEAGIVQASMGCGPNDLLAHEPAAGVLAEIRAFLAAQRGRVDGIVCAEYSVLPALLRVLKQEGLTPDRDIHIAVVDEDYLAPQGCRFAHMRQNEAAIAEKATELLLRRMGGKVVTTEDFLIPAIFVEKQ